VNADGNAVAGQGDAGVLGKYLGGGGLALADRDVRDNEGRTARPELDPTDQVGLRLAGRGGGGSAGGPAGGLLPVPGLGSLVTGRPRRLEEFTFGSDSAN